MHDVPPPASSHEKKPQRPAQPYLDWALATRFSYLRKGDWIPLLIEFDAKEAQRSQGDEKLTALQAFATRRWLADEPRTLDDKLIIPDLFAAPGELLKNASHFNFCVALIRSEVGIVRTLTQLDGWKRTVLRVELGPPIDLADKKSSPVTPDSASAPPAPSAPPSGTPPSSKQGIRQSFLARLRRLIPFAGSRFIGGPALPPSASASVPARPDSPASASSPGAAPAQLVDQSLAPHRSGTAEKERIKRVVIAVIDQGIAFANSRFFSESEPRIEYLWQQNVLGTSMPATGMTMPFTPGFELDKSRIKDAVAEAKSKGANNEWVYREHGGLSFSVDGYKPLARRRTHGTHVLDLAAGGTDASRHPIIAVDMPEDAVGDPAGSTLSVQAAWALIYILDRAERLRRKPDEKLPVVANLSYGPHEGPHDGTGVLERFMDQIWDLAKESDTPLEIVLAAGNFRQTRTHAAFDLETDTDKHLQWRLQPGSLSASLMEIWLPPGSGHQVTVTLTPPFTSATLTPATVSANDPDKPVANAAGNVLYRAQYVAASGGVQADSIVLSIARTAPDPADDWGDAVAPSGPWRVTLNAKAATKGLKAWIRRCDTLSGRRAKGRQSYFDDPAYARFASNGRPHDFDPEASTSYVKRYQSLSGIATGEHTRVIGGYRQSDCFPAPYSSHGTHLKSAVEVGPDWLEYSDDSDALPGVHAAGTSSGSVTAMNGSSVAAPQATRWIADQWVAKRVRPVARPGLLPIALYSDRPIPPLELPFAAGDGRVGFKPRWPPRRQ